MQDFEAHGPEKRRLDPLCAKDFSTPEEYEEACNQLRAKFDERFAKARAELAADLEKHCANFKKIHLPAPDLLNRARHYVTTYALLPGVKLVRALHTEAKLAAVVEARA